MKNSKKTIIALIVLALLLAGCFFAWKTIKPSGDADVKNITVNVRHLDGDVKTFDLKTDSEYLRGALEGEGIISGREDEYGLWIDTVDGEKADESLQQWWGYDINGETAMYGADEQVISDGDVIDFTLNEGY